MVQLASNTRLKSICHMSHRYGANDTNANFSYFLSIRANVSSFNIASMSVDANAYKGKAGANC